MARRRLPRFGDTQLALAASTNGAILRATDLRRDQRECARPAVRTALDAYSVGSSRLPRPAKQVGWGRPVGFFRMGRSR